MDAITLTIALLAVGRGPAKPSVAIVGTWRVQLSQQVLDVDQKLGIAEPQVQFVFNPDKTYAFSSNAGGILKTSNGKYELDDRTVKLSPVNSDWLSGHTCLLKDDNSLDVDGLTYVKSDASALVGTWTLRNSSGEDKSTKIVFDKKGKFSFVSSFATSKGTYTSDGTSVTLTWTEIDEAPVEAGTVHKTVPLNPDGSLQIDTFRYLKA